ncbi:MAG: MarR family transcriptional regulator [Chloroflexi bacterium]|nr:MarR family transcriptional regulator [Chloroflexota bacterium]
MMLSKQIQKLFAEMMGLIYERELRIMRQFGLSLLEYYVLQVLSFARNSSLKEIGQRLALPKSTVTFVADALERKVLVQRQQDRQDRRVWHICLTEAGRSLIEEIFASKALFLLPTFDGLSNAEAQALLKVLEGITEQLRETHQKTERSDKG